MISLDELMQMPHKVFIGLPQGELARYSDFDATLECVLTPPNTLRKRLFGIYIANIQNDLVRIFLQTDYEWFWLLNDDQLYTPDTLINLLSHDKEIVVPLCLEKKFPHGPLIYEKGVNSLFPYRYLRRGEKGLIPIGGAGGGGMLIHRQVFEVIPDPWWEVHTAPDENGKMVQTTEDLDFATKVSNAGFQMWCDLDTSVAHIAHYALRAMIDPASGEWCTVMMRGEEKLAIPAAQDPNMLTKIQRPTDRDILAARQSKWKSQ